MSLVIHSLWAAVAVYFVHTAAGVVREFKAAPVAPVLPPPVEIPEDLVAVANQEREPWAQEEVLRAIRERYEEVRDWNRVRAAFGVGRID